MSNQRYTPEFRDEAVRQIIERGFSVTEVAERLGVSANSLYKWVKAEKPDTSWSRRGQTRGRTTQIVYTHLN